MKTNENDIHGILAGFESHEELVAACRKLKQEGYQSFEAYTPYPVSALHDLVPNVTTKVARFFLVGGVIGGLGGYFMEWYAMAVDYPLNIGGKPFNSWPMYIPVTFELTVLLAALSGFAGLIITNRLPRYYHAVSNIQEFERASCDRFFVCIEAKDKKFDRSKSEELLKSFHPYLIAEVPA